MKISMKEISIINMSNRNEMSMKRNENEEIII